MLLVSSLPPGISDVSICDASVLRLSCPSCLCSSVVVAVHSMSGVPCVSGGCVFIFLSNGSFTNILDSSEQVLCVGVVACFVMADCVSLVLWATISAHVELDTTVAGGPTRFLRGQSCCRGPVSSHL